MEILQKIKYTLTGWQQNTSVGRGEKISCHNMSEEHIKTILECMEKLQCSLHISPHKQIRTSKKDYSS